MKGIVLYFKIQILGSPEPEYLFNSYLFGYHKNQVFIHARERIDTYKMCCHCQTYSRLCFISSSSSLKEWQESSVKTLQTFRRTFEALRVEWWNATRRTCDLSKY